MPSRPVLIGRGLVPQTLNQTYKTPRVHESSSQPARARPPGATVTGQRTTYLNNGLAPAPPHGEHTREELEPQELRRP